MTFHVERDAKARVKWGDVTVAIGPAEIDAESVPGVVVLKVLAKGTRWAVEVPAEQWPAERPAAAARPD